MTAETLIPAAFLFQAFTEFGQKQYGARPGGRARVDPGEKIKIF
jgi:hypothetical protein